MSKKLINGLKYEKLTEDQLYDLSQWELVDIILAYRNELLRKEQECEELKIYIESNEQQVKEVETLVMDNDRLINELDQLKTVLTEIKEIAEKIDDSDGCAYGDYDCDNCSSLEQETVCTYKVKKLILQKISECEGNND